jgi:hypothetical protein
MQVCGIEIFYNPTINLRFNIRSSCFDLKNINSILIENLKTNAEQFRISN